jgi:RNA polymerase sigma-70 factor (ECF subfamily)
MTALDPQPEELDATLAARVAAGDEEALQALHGRYAPLVFHLACKSLDRPAAEEITQDVFLSLWRRAGTFEIGKASFRTWLLSITHHRILDELRNRSRRPEGPLHEQVELSAQDPLPDETVWKEYRRGAIASALATLPDTQRRALRLAFFSELSHEEVAQALQVPLGTAKTRIRNGLRRLTPQLGGLVAVLVAAMGIGVTYRFYRHQRAHFDQTDRALHLLADSQARTLRLLPPGAEALPEGGLHAAFRGIPGRGIAVLTLSHFPSAVAGSHYEVWAKLLGTWRDLGVVLPDPEGKGLMVLEHPELARGWPEELRICVQTETTPLPPPRVLVQWASEATKPN